MKRREFIILAAGAAAWPLKGHGQQQGQPRRIGVLIGYALTDPEGRSRLTAFREKLSELGWIEGRSVELLVRATDGRPELITSMTMELASSHPDVLVVGGAPALVAMRRLTRDIPIVFVFVSDPVGMGEIETLAKPGGNATGFTPFEPSLGGKWVEFLKQLTPSVARVGIIFNPKTAPNSSVFVRSAETAAAALGLSIVLSSSTQR